MVKEFCARLYLGFGVLLLLFCVGFLFSVENWQQFERALVFGALAGFLWYGGLWILHPLLKR